MLNKKGIPLYVQLKDKLFDDIKKNYKVGDIIPTENQIEKLYNVSKVTVRRAIVELQNEGIVEKKQGRGTFVKEPKILYDANSIGSLTQRLQKQNISLKTKTIEFEYIKKPHYVKELLECESLLCIKRLRVINETPFAYMKNYIDPDRVPQIEEHFKIQSLYTFLKQEYAIEFYNANETIEANGADEMLAKYLNIPVNAPLLRLKRLSFDPYDKPIEYSDIHIKSDMYVHQIRLKNEKLSNYGRLNIQK